MILINPTVNEAKTRPITVKQAHLQYGTGIQNIPKIRKKQKYQKNKNYGHQKPCDVQVYIILM